MSRVERLAEKLELPLLVTAAVNVRYLTGFRSSNAALPVEKGGRARDLHGAGRPVLGVTQDPRQEDHAPGLRQHVLDGGKDRGAHVALGVGSSQNS